MPVLLKVARKFDRQRRGDRAAGHEPASPGRSRPVLAPNPQNRRVGSQLDRARIEEAFLIMGRYLLDRKAFGEIAIYGGSAILFQFDWRKSSHDVDARIVSDGSHGLVIQAIREAATPERFGLRVLADKPAYILAMKLKALERTTADDRDYRDAVKLGIASGATTADGLRDVFRKFFPDEALPLVAELRLGDLAQAIQVEAG